LVRFLLHEQKKMNERKFNLKTKFKNITINSKTKNEKLKIPQGENQ